MVNLYCPYGVLQLVDLYQHMECSIWSLFADVWSVSSDLFKHSIWSFYINMWSTPYGHFISTYGVIYMVTLCGHMECFKWFI